MLVPAKNRLYLAEGGFTTPTDVGRLVPASLAWDEARGRFLEMDYWEASAAQRQGMSEVERQQYDDLHGVVYEPGLEAAMLAWRIRYCDIDPTFWWGPPVTDPETGAYLPGSDGGPRYTWRGRERGLWRIIRPAKGEGTSYLQQYDAQENLTFELTSAGKLRQNPCFCISLYREATPKSETESDDSDAPKTVPYTYTGFGWGGQWNLRFPKAQPAQLYKLIGGQWKLVAWHEWQIQELYAEGYGAKEIYICVLCVDGKILIKSNTADEAWVYSDQRQQITVPSAPLTLCGNSGPAYFGLHDIQFAGGPYNRLIARSSVTLDRVPAAAPLPVAVGSKPKQTSARCYAAGADATEQTTPSRTFHPVVELTGDGAQTPVVKLAGLHIPALLEAGPRHWQDVTSDFISCSGGWTWDLDERVISQSYVIKVRNETGRYSNVRQNILMRWCCGREYSGSESWVNGQPAERLVTVARIIDDTIPGVAAGTAQIQTIDRTEILDTIECGQRRPIGGMTVAAAMREVLSWGHVMPAEIGAIYDSGVVLPASSRDMTYTLQTLTDEVGGALDMDRGPIAMRPDASVLSALKFLAAFDARTYLGFDAHGLYRYAQQSTTSIRSFRETASPAAEDEMRNEITHRPRTKSGAATIIVEGREMQTGRPLRATAVDVDAMTRATSPRFRGHDSVRRGGGEELNLVSLVQLRCRNMAEWERRLRDQVSFEAVGQLLMAGHVISVTDRTGSNQWYVLSTDETSDAGGEWTLTVDAVRS